MWSGRGETPCVVCIRYLARTARQAKRRSRRKSSAKEIRTSIGSRYFVMICCPTSRGRKVTLPDQKGQNEPSEEQERREKKKAGRKGKKKEDCRFSDWRCQQSIAATTCGVSSKLSNIPARAGANCGYVLYRLGYNTAQYMHRGATFCSSLTRRKRTLSLLELQLLE